MVFGIVAGPTGFEPATYGLRASAQKYGPPLYLTELPEPL